MRIFPSLLSADFSCLKTSLEPLIRAGIKQYHLDIMDGNFVPNISYGPPVIRSLRSGFPELEFDAHLMVRDPLVILEPLLEIGVEYISVHLEIDLQFKKIRELCQQYGTKLGLVYNPDTEISRGSALLEDVDFVLLMAVQPGFGGQKFRPGVLSKVDQLRSVFSGPIQLDGGVNLDNIEEIVAAGIDWVVSGSTIFESMDPAETIKQFEETV